MEGSSAHAIATIVEEIKMIPSSKLPFSRLIFCVWILMISLSCQFLTDVSQNLPPLASTLQNSVPAATLADASTDSSEPSSPDAHALISGPNPLDALINMRSVIIRLKIQQPDGSMNSTQIEIDSTGNLHEIKSMPPLSKEGLPPGVEAPERSDHFEIFVIGGKAYIPSEINKEWKSKPVDEDFLPTVSSFLHSGYGLATWLDLLPEGSLTSAGQETVGGFNADKYTVKGTVGEQEITGSLWYEPQTGALVKAELNVPAVLYDESLSGQVKISLDTQKAQVAAIALPK
jgi:hypothetical protein